MTRHRVLHPFTDAEGVPHEPGELIDLAESESRSDFYRVLTVASPSEPEPDAVSPN